MKITTILGSPRKRGNTATILRHFEELIGNSHEVNRINIARKNLNGCLGCEACQRILDKPGCVQKDDFSEIIHIFLNSDITVYASPVYVWDFSSQLKTLLDRQYCMMKRKNSNDMRFLMEGKQSVLLTTCGGDAENNADLIQEIFKRAMDYHHCRIIGKYVVPQCPSTLPSEIADEYPITAQQMYDDLIKEHY